MAMVGKIKHYRFADVHRQDLNYTVANYLLRADAEVVIERVLASTTGDIERWQRDCQMDSRSEWPTRSLRRLRGKRS
jgi:hypothetical protein